MLATRPAVARVSLPRVCEAQPQQKAVHLASKALAAVARRTVVRGFVQAISQPDERSHAVLVVAHCESMSAQASSPETLASSVDATVAAVALAAAADGLSGAVAAAAACGSVPTQQAQQRAQSLVARGPVVVVAQPEWVAAPRLPLPTVAAPQLL